MTIIYILITLIVIFGLIALYALAWQSLNEHCNSKYSYQPLSVTTLFGTGVPIVAMYFGIGFFLQNGTPEWITTPETITLVALHSPEFNGLVAAVLGIFGILSLFIYQVLKTSILSAIAALVLLIIASSLVVIFIILLLMAIFGGGSDNRKRVYVVKD